jgi:hypothetical protein
MDDGGKFFFLGGGKFISQKYFFPHFFSGAFREIVRANKSKASPVTDRGGV